MAFANAQDYSEAGATINRVGSVLNSIDASIEDVKATIESERTEAQADLKKIAALQQRLNALPDWARQLTESDLDGLAQNLAQAKAIAKKYLEDSKTILNQIN